METHTTKWNIKQIAAMIEGSTILFDYPIQRADDQWTIKQKSDLVHSCLIDLPIPPVYFLSFAEDRTDPKNGKQVKVNVRQVMDGKQRLTNLHSYYKDEFALLPTYNDLFIIDQSYEIAGKKFSELDEPVQNLFLSKGIPSYTVAQEFTTDEEIELLFFRLNASKPLTTHQKAKSIVGIKFQTILNGVATHKTILELSNFAKSHIRDNKHQAAILQTMMLLEGFEFKNFSANENSRYAETFKDDFDNKLETLSKVEQALDYLATVFKDKEKFLLKPVSFPMTVSLAYDCSVNNVEPDLFYLWATAFVDAVSGEKEVNIPTYYIDYTKSGSTDLAKVRGRVNSMRKHFDEFMALMNEKQLQTTETI